MKDVDDYLKVRQAVRIEGLSERAAARRFGIDPRTVNKMMKFSVPPGYKRKKPPAKPKLDPFILVIDRILRDDKSQPKKQQHTAKQAKRVFERLRDEYGFTGGSGRKRCSCRWCIRQGTSLNATDDADGFTKVCLSSAMRVPCTLRTA